MAHATVLGAGVVGLTCAVALREAGWEVVHVTAALLRAPDALVAAVRSAERRQQLR